MPDTTMREPRNISEALVVTPPRVTDVDWEDVGGILADQHSDRQAQFLVGMANGFASVDGLMQMEFIASDLASRNITERFLVRDMLANLLERVQQ